jgi:Tol biopolymer transport system component
MTIAGKTDDVWTYDFTTGALTQLTFDANHASPIWSHDGRRVVFSSTRSGVANLFWMPAEGGAEERLTTSDHFQLPGAWSPDGSLLAFVERHPSSGRDIWMLRAGGDLQPTPFLASGVDEGSPRFSPDGRWLAYVSNESGQNEIYLAAVSGALRARRVSQDGGAEPVWGPDGDELFYRAGDRLMAARLGGADRVVAGRRAVFDAAPYARGTFEAANYDVMRDGTRFVTIRAGENAPAQAFHILLGGLPSLVTVPPR